MALSGFAPSGYASITALPVSANVALPAGTTALVSNLGPNPAFVLLGNSAVTVTPQTGTAVLPGQSLPLTVGGNTYLAAVTSQGGAPAVLNIAVGT